jgi:hypothetical protein
MYGTEGIANNTSRRTSSGIFFDVMCTLKRSETEDLMSIWLAMVWRNT